MEHTQSLNHGTIPLYRNIIKGLDSNFARKISEYQIDSILLSGGNNEISSYFAAEHIRFINEAAENYANELLGSLNESGIDMQSSFVVFSGGGSILLSPWLENPSLSHYTMINDISANAKGYEVFARAQLARGR